MSTGLGTAPSPALPDVGDCRCPWPCEGDPCLFLPTFLGPRVWGLAFGPSPFNFGVSLAGLPLVSVKTSIAEASGVWSPPFLSAVGALWRGQSASLRFLPQDWDADSDTEVPWALKRSQVLVVFRPPSVLGLACPVCQACAGRGSGQHCAPKGPSWGSPTSQHKGSCTLPLGETGWAQAHLRGDWVRVWLGRVPSPAQLGLRRGRRLPELAPCPLPVCSVFWSGGTEDLWDSSEGCVGRVCTCLVCSHSGQGQPLVSVACGSWS